MKITLNTPHFLKNIWLQCFVFSMLGFFVSQYNLFIHIFFIVIGGLVSVFALIVFICESGVSDMLDDDLSTLQRTTAYFLSFIVGLAIFSHVNQTWYESNNAMFYDKEIQKVVDMPVRKDYLYVLDSSTVKIENVHGLETFNVVDGLNAYKLEIDYEWKREFVELNPTFDYADLTIALLDEYFKNGIQGLTPSGMMAHACQKLKSENYTFESCPFVVVGVEID